VNKEWWSPLHQHLHAEQHLCRKQPAHPHGLPAPSLGLTVLLLSVSSLQITGKMSLGPKNSRQSSEEAAWSVLALRGGGVLQGSWLWHLMGGCMLQATDAPTRGEQSRGARHKCNCLAFCSPSLGATFPHVMHGL